jgi:hypothetical protein
MKTYPRFVSPQSTACTRRQFLLTAAGAAMTPSLLSHLRAGDSLTDAPIRPAGPGAECIPHVHAAFVRRKEDYGMLWPGAVYDGKTALRNYRDQILSAEEDLGIRISLRPTPLFSMDEAKAWVAEATASRPDGLMVVVMDRQRHAWPTANLAIDTGIPTVIFSPIGTSFTTNTTAPSQKPNNFIASTSDFAQARYGLKMIRAATKLRAMRYLVLKGTQRQDTPLAFFGTQLRYLPASSFLEEYQQLKTTPEIRRMADDYVRHARRVYGASEQDLINGIKSYVVARNLLEREKADAITMDCLGALGRSKVSLPCIAWSKMLDDGIPAACEADLGACVTHALVQLLFDRPGFQQDPVAETARECLIGAHCSCPTRLSGFAERAEPYDILHHHGNRDAVPRPLWKRGQRVTIADVILPSQSNPAPQMLIGSGTVTDNVSVPPAGGCVVSVMVELDNDPDLLSYPGFHQIFFYGDYRRELAAYCKLFGLAAVMT